MKTEKNSVNTLSTDKLFSNICSKIFQIVQICYDLFIRHTIKLHINAIKYKF